METSLLPDGMKSPSDVALQLREKVRLFPEKSGVYRMYDKKGVICYIGKAKNLRHRVSSYFNSSQKRLVTHILLSKVFTIDYLVTQTETEALILENNLIKRHQPFFNIDLKDNKTYPYLLLTTEYGYPRLVKTRSLQKKGMYFGPYTNVPLMHAFLEAVNHLYPLKKCSQNKFPKNFKPCLYYHIGECLDYCRGGVKRETIKKMIDEIKDLLRGNHGVLVKKLKEEMKLESARENFERALTFRNIIDTFTQLTTEQSVSTTGEDHFDALHYTTDEKHFIIALLQFRMGKLVNKHIFDFETPLFSEDQVEAAKEPSNYFLVDTFSRFLYDYYSRQEELIGEVLLPSSLFVAYDGAEEELLNSLTSAIEKKNKERDDKKIPLPLLVTPQKGAKKRFLKLAEVNAALSLQELVRKNQRNNVLKLVKEKLLLTRLPKVIESFDVANTADRHIMAGMVRYVDGRKEKAGYRLFHIKHVSHQDDFMSMKEAVFRRYDRLIREKKDLPDLVMIDGGKGQLSAAKSALDSLKLPQVPIISLAKKEEWIYLSAKGEPLKLPHTHAVLRFLVEIRDETHRFINSSHVRKRDKDELKSCLEEVKGLGEKKIKILLTRFDNLEQIKQCTPKQIEELPFFGRKDYQALAFFFKKQDDKILKNTFQ